MKTATLATKPVVATTSNAAPTKPISQRVEFDVNDLTNFNAQYRGVFEIKAVTHGKVTLRVYGTEVDITLYSPSGYATEQGEQISTNIGLPKAVRLMTLGKMSDAAQELKAEALRIIRQSGAVKVRAQDKLSILQTTIGLSNALEVGTYAIDEFDRLILPAEWAMAQDWDCDGDGCYVIERFNVEAEAVEGIVVKMPLKGNLHLLKKVNPPKEKMEDLTETSLQNKGKAKDWVKNTALRQYNAILKTGSNPPLGIITNRWWSLIMFDVRTAMVQKPNQNTFWSALFDSIEVHGKNFQDDLESKGMKAASKGTGSSSSSIYNIFEQDVPVMGDITSVLWGTKGAVDRARIGLDSFPHIVKVLGRDVKAFDFQVPAVQKPAKSVFAAWMLNPKIGCSDLATWLQKTGYLKVRLLETASTGTKLDNKFFPITLALSNPKKPGEAVAFEWNKENGNSQIGYLCVLCPIVAYDEETSKAVLMDPFSHLNYWLSRNFQCPNIYSSKYIEGLFNDTREKASALDAALRKYVSEYGIMIPSIKNEKGEHVPNKFGFFFTKTMITVDHASFSPLFTSTHTPEMMAAITQIADKVCKNELGHGIHFAATGKNRGVRRHFLAKEDGLPFFTKRNAEIPCQAHRPGRNLSLLVRTSARINALTAIVDTGSNIQAFITPKGIANSQPEDDIFLPEISSVPVEGWKLTPFNSWFGEVRYVWVSPTAKKESKPIGKFVCQNGSRFEPRFIEQCFDHNANEVDIIMPIEELREKALVDEFMNTPNGYWGTLILNDGQEVKAFFVKRQFLRSGAAGENIKPRYHREWGMQGFCGAAMAASLDHYHFPFEFGGERQEALVQKGKAILDASLVLLSKYGASSNSQTENGDSEDQYYEDYD